jgi:hypothetical protein
MYGFRVRRGTPFQTARPSMGQEKSAPQSRGERAAEGPISPGCETAQTAQTAQTAHTRARGTRSPDTPPGPTRHTPPPLYLTPMPRSQ